MRAASMVRKDRGRAAFLRGNGSAPPRNISYESRFPLYFPLCPAHRRRNRKGRNRRKGSLRVVPIDLTLPYQRSFHILYTSAHYKYTTILDKTSGVMGKNYMLNCARIGIFKE